MISSEILRMYNKKLLLEFGFYTFIVYKHWHDDTENCKISCLFNKIKKFTIQSTQIKFLWWSFLVDYIVAEHNVFVSFFKLTSRKNEPKTINLFFDLNMFATISCWMREVLKFFCNFSRWAETKRREAIWCHLRRIVTKINGQKSPPSSSCY